MNLPAISIIIPTFNRSDLLQQTLKSLGDQTFLNWEALVVDDGSTDGTLTQIQQFSQADPRIRCVRRSRQKTGAPACRNEGTDLAQGNYIIYLDSDDCLAPTALMNRFQVMERHPELDFGIFPCVLFRDHPGDMQLLWNADNGVNDIDRFLAFDLPWQTTSPLWRREALAKLGPWNEELPSWQDFEFHLRALITGLKYKRFSSPDCFWRIPHHKSIGDQSRGTKHLTSHEKLFSDVQLMLSQTGLLSDRRKYLLCGLYFWLVDAWASQGKKLEAIQAWQRCREHGLINQSLYLQGVWYIEVSTIWMPHQLARKALRRMTREYFNLTWSEGLLPKWSKTFRKTPLSTFYQQSS